MTNLGNISFSQLCVKYVSIIGKYFNILADDVPFLSILSRSEKRKNQWCRSRKFPSKKCFSRSAQHEPSGNLMKVGKIGLKWIRAWLQIP